MKKLYCYSSDEYDWFFNDDYDLIHWWHTNDASFRIGYMSGLFKYFDIEVEYIKSPNKKVKSQIQKVIKDNG